jgi:glycosyltransferase involved in cell wall biosynthesis
MNWDALTPDSKTVKMAGPNIAYILLWFPEPTQTFILDEVNTLIRLGTAVKVYTLYGPQSPGRVAGMAPVTAPVRHLGLGSLASLLKELTRFWTNQSNDARQFLTGVIFRRWRSLETAGEALWATLTGVYLAQMFLRHGVRHIHAPWADGPATAAWVASQLSGIPYSFCAHAHDIYPPDGALEEKLAASAWVRVISEANRHHLATLAPEDANKLVTIYCGTPVTTTPAPPRLLSPPHRLLALGRLIKKKGFDVLLSACHHLASRGVDFRLTLAGAGPQLRKLQRLVREYGLEDQVGFPGFVPHRQVSQLFNQADLFIMPSRVDPAGDRDGIPVVVLESLAHAVPVVGTDVSALPEVILPGETGWLAPPDDPPALAWAIMEALADPREARRRAEAGRALVSRQFDSQTNYARLKAWLENSACKM